MLSYDELLLLTQRHVESAVKLAACGVPDVVSQAATFRTMAKGAVGLWYALALEMTVGGDRSDWEEFQADHARLEHLADSVGH